MVLFLNLSCLPRGVPGRHANIVNPLKIMFLQRICLGGLFAPSAKRTNFRAPAHAKLQEKHVQKQPPRRVETNLKNIDFGPPNGSNILTKSLPEAYRRPLAPQDAPKSSKPRPKRPQKRAKSAPRAPGSDFHVFPGPQLETPTIPKETPAILAPWKNGG